MMTTYYLNEQSMGGFVSEADARRMTELLAARGYDLVYGFGDKVIKELGDLLAAWGYDGGFNPCGVIEIVPDTPLSTPARAWLDWDECIDIMSEEHWLAGTLVRVLEQM